MHPFKIDIVFTGIFLLALLKNWSRPIFKKILNFFLNAGFSGIWAQIWLYNFLKKYLKFF